MRPSLACLAALLAALVCLCPHSLSAQETEPSTRNTRNTLAGTKWVNSNNAAFEWTTDGRFLHRGVEREWKILDAHRVQIIFNPNHKDTLVFNSSFTEFRQLIKGGPASMQGRRVVNNGRDEPPAGPSLVVRNRVLHPVDRRLFGQFLERPHFAFETGVEAGLIPGTHRLQPKVLQMLRELGATVFRFPDGVNLDAFDWTDMIDNVPGRSGGRPVVDLGKGEKINNAFGYDEFLQLCEELKAEPLLVVNVRKAVLEKRPAAEAARQAAALLAYCNGRLDAKLPPDLDRWRDLRIKNGRRDPYRVRYFQVGNETFFFRPELQKKYPADHLQRYLSLIKLYVRELKAVDPDIQIVIDSIGAAGDLAIRRELGDGISFLAEHYYRPLEMKEFKRSGASVSTAALTQRDLWNGFVASGSFDPTTGQSIMPLASVDGRRRHGYPVAVTEWNWNGWWTATPSTAPQEIPLAWGVGAAGMLHGLMRSGHSVSIACQSLAVGKNWGITGIRADPSGRADPYFMPTGQVVALYAQRHGDRLLETVPRAIPTFEQPLKFGFVTPSSRVAALDTLATEKQDAVYLHLINRDFERTIDLDVDLTELKSLKGTGTRYTLAGRLNKRPGPGETRQVASVEQSAVRAAGGALRLRLAARTVTCVELEKRP